MDDWAGAPHSEAAVGDSGPWTRHLPTLWAALADPRGRHPVPPPASARDPHGDQIAYWAPLPQLLHFVLGWRHGAAGLAAWDAAGRPTDGPATALLERWWGPRLEHYMAWSMVSGIGQVAHAAAEAGGTEPPGPPGLADSYAQVRREPDWQGVWGGGGDSLHLAHHATVPLWGAGPGGAAWLLPAHTAPGQPPRAALLLDGYAGWYAALARGGRELPPAPSGRSWRVDVVVRPLGHLGTFRRSRLTGRWFAGRHRDHGFGD